MYKNEPVSLEILMRICIVFHCNIGEVILDE
ncbi:helix-turn-helix domain-containing protein [Erysipelatoclostridium sp. An173]